MKPIPLFLILLNIPHLTTAQIAAVDSRAHLVTDSAASSITFSVRFMGLRRVFGEFHDFDGALDFDEANPGNSYASFSVAVASIDTDNNWRDDDLSQNWFEMDPYPTATFASDSIRRAGNDWTVFGKFQLKDVTRDIAVDVSLDRLPDGALQARGRFVIDRMIYGVDDDPTSNAFFDASKMIVGDNVTVVIDFVLKSEE